MMPQDQDATSVDQVPTASDDPLRDDRLRDDPLQDGTADPAADDLAEPTDTGPTDTGPGVDAADDDAVPDAEWVAGSKGAPWRATAEEDEEDEEDEEGEEDTAAVSDEPAEPGIPVSSRPGQPADEVIPPGEAVQPVAGATPDEPATAAATLGDEPAAPAAGATPDEPATAAATLGDEPATPAGTLGDEPAAPAATLGDEPAAPAAGVTPDEPATPASATQATSVTAGVPGTGARADAAGAALVPNAEQLHQNWAEIQSGFVDDPRASVTDAADLVADVTRTLVTAVQERERTLREAWDGDSNSDTENLRNALRDYRAFFELLIKV